jgi:hypothetical protein
MMKMKGETMKGATIRDTVNKKEILKSAPAKKQNLAREALIRVR